MSRRALLLLLVVLAAASGCFAEELEGQTASTPVELDSATDPVVACPIPAPGAIAGHEAVFYECAEDSADHGAGCGPSGYLIGYGARYARRFFQHTRPMMSARGRRWIDDVVICLQRDLRDAIDVTTSCDDIWETAFDSHPGCYVEAGFCSLPLLDILDVVWTIDLHDWLSVDAARQIVHTAASCGRSYALVMQMFFSDLLDEP